MYLLIFSYANMNFFKKKKIRLTKNVTNTSAHAFFKPIKPVE